MGSSQTPKILARDPTSFEQGAKRRYRLFDKQMLDSILLKSIDKSINELRGHSPKYDEDPDVEDTRHTLIQALKNFRRAYTYWLFPDAVFGNSNMNPVLEGSSNDSPDTQDSFRGNRTKRENGAEREGRHKFRRGSDGGRLSGHQEAEDYD